MTGHHRKGVDKNIDGSILNEMKQVPAMETPTRALTLRVPF